MGDEEKERWETKREGDGATRRKCDGETRRKGDGETRRKCDGETGRVRASGCTGVNRSLFQWDRRNRMGKSTRGASSL